MDARSVTLVTILVLGIEVGSAAPLEPCEDPVARASAKELVELVRHRETLAGDPANSVLVASLDALIAQKKDGLGHALQWNAASLHDWLQTLVASGDPPESLPPPRPPAPEPRRDPEPPSEPEISRDPPAPPPAPPVSPAPPSPSPSYPMSPGVHIVEGPPIIVVRPMRR